VLLWTSQGLTVSKTLDDFCPTSLLAMNMSYRILAVLALAVVCVTAETHRVSFQNRSVMTFTNPKKHH